MGQTTPARSTLNTVEDFETAPKRATKTTNFATSRRNFRQNRIDVFSSAELVLIKDARKLASTPEAKSTSSSPTWTHNSAPTTIRDFDERIAREEARIAADKLEASLPVSRLSLKSRSKSEAQPLTITYKKRGIPIDHPPFVAVTMEPEQLRKQFPAGVYRVDIPVQLRAHVDVESIPVCRLERGKLVTVKEVKLASSNGKRCVRAHVTSPTMGWTSLISTSLKQCLKLEIPIDNEELQELANRSRVKDMSIAERQHTRKSKARQIRRTTQLQQLALEADRRAQDLFEHPETARAVEPEEKEAVTKPGRKGRRRRRSRRSRRRRREKSQAVQQQRPSTTYTTSSTQQQFTQGYNPIVYPTHESPSVMSTWPQAVQPVVYQMPTISQYAPTHGADSSNLSLGLPAYQAPYTESPAMTFSEPMFDRFGSIKSGQMSYAQTPTTYQRQASQQMLADYNSGFCTTAGVTFDDDSAVID